MAVTEIHEGVKKDLTLNVPRDTSGETIVFWAYDKSDETAQGIELGSITGGPPNTDLVLAGALTNLLTADKEYLIEVWVDADIDTRMCLHPADNEDEIFSVRDRRRVSI